MMVHHRNNKVDRRYHHGNFKTVKVNIF